MTKPKLALIAAPFLSIVFATSAVAAVADTTETMTAPSTVGAAVAVGQKSPNSKECKKDPGLFDRLGGFFGIAKVVDDFSNAILQNAVLNANPALAEWTQTQAATRLPGLKFLRTMWIASMVGGPIKYTGQSLEQAHARFNMTAAEFAEVGTEIVKALQAAGVAQADIDLAVCLYQTSMDEVVASSDALEPRTPPSQ